MDWGTELQFYHCTHHKFSLTCPSSLQTKVKFMKKNQSYMIASTWHEQISITYVTLGVLQLNKDFQTPFEQANNKVLIISFTKKQAFQKFTEFFNNIN